MRWRFPPHVHAASVNGDLVILDLAADEYVCVPGAGRRPAGPFREPRDLDPEVIETLVEAGLLKLARAAGEERRRLPEPARLDLRDQPAPRVRLRDLLDAVGAWRDLTRRGPDARVQNLLTLARHRGRSVEAPRRILHAAAVFAQVLPWLPVRNQCLHRSALLVAFLARKGLDADWVFGVRTWPFRAHCWVQYGDVCLNDDRERLRAYAVIFSTGGASSGPPTARRQIRHIGQDALGRRPAPGAPTAASDRGSV